MGFLQIALRGEKGMGKDVVTVKLAIIPVGLVVSAKGRNFYLQHHTLRSIVHFAQNFPESFDIYIYVNDVKQEDTVTGANNTEKIENLKVWLQDLIKKNQILLKDEAEFQEELKAI
ncbi:MAG: hypothetical protein UR96_C0047G0007 [candidate division WS6 bacterium GW2011_GWC1_36_11]|uniref:Uncharacterized protein n=1 Tax=candidate division WS6 bacterium GW2011_GWC1_36_11 TaxID=1619090 RepID=A0A0G0GEF5_9BACT|nr:MAG: hypothetical protein UR96_C0047G0007 [candidate division WS6 bacterium GW2011_GWC1_36_11]